MVKSKSLSDIIEEAVERYHDSGEALTVAQLADEFGLSRNTIRRALGRATQGRKPMNQEAEKLKRGYAIQYSLEGQRMVWRTVEMCITLLQDATASKDICIILDIDEVLLCNEPHIRWLIDNGKLFPSRWDAWCKRGECKPITGMEYLLTEHPSAHIYAISSRSPSLQEATEANIHSAYPKASFDGIICAGNDKLDVIVQTISKHGVAYLLLDDKALPPMGAKYQIIMPNYVYGQHSAKV